MLILTVGKSGKICPFVHSGYLVKCIGNERRFTSIWKCTNHLRGKIWKRCANLDVMLSASSKQETFLAMPKRLSNGWLVRTKCSQYKLTNTEINNYKQAKGDLPKYFHIRQAITISKHWGIVVSQQQIIFRRDVTACIQTLFHSTQRNWNELLFETNLCANIGDQILTKT